MVVYFIQAESSKLIKIGKTENVAKRLRELQRHSPEKLKLLGVVHAARHGPLLQNPNAVTLEYQLHRKFEHLREHGEWFREAPELLSYIATYSTLDLDKHAPSNAREDQQPVEPDLERYINFFANGPFHPTTVEQLQSRWTPERWDYVVNQLPCIRRALLDARTKNLANWNRFLLIDRAVLGLDTFAFGVAAVCVVRSAQA